MSFAEDFVVTTAPFVRNPLGGNMDDAPYLIFEQCSEKADFILQCVSDSLEAGQRANMKSSNTWFLLFAAALIFFMQAGFAMLCAGSVRVKNVGTCAIVLLFIGFTEKSRY